MCKNVFKNTEEKARKEAFTRLYAVMVSSSLQGDVTGRRIRQINSAVKSEKR